MLETEAAPLIEKNYRWNFTVNVLDGATFWFGMSFLSSAVILPLAPLLGGFLGGLCGYPVLFAISAAVAVAGWIVYRFGVSDPRGIRKRKD